MEGKFNHGRRNLLRTGVLAGASFLVPDIAKKFLGKEEIPPEKELTVEDYLVQIEKVTYPDLKEVPEFLQPYAKEFKSWKDVVESQQKLASEFLNSKLVRDSLLFQYTEGYPGKTEQEVVSMVDKLIEDRKLNFGKTKKVTYKEIKDCLGRYFSKSKELLIDTLQNVPHAYVDKSEEDFETKTVDMFVALHEFWHSATLPKLIPAVVFDKIIVYLAENNVITEKFKDKQIRWAERDKTRTRKQTSESAVSSDNLGYFQSPNEVYAFMMHIRGNLHIVSQYNPGLVKFDMFKDKFTQEHLTFLKNNQSKIFVDIHKYEDKNGTLVEVTKSIFTKQLENFKDEQFVDLMNIAV